MKRLAVITPTGERREAFSICSQLMQRQNIPRADWIWIIVDDSTGNPIQDLIPVSSLSINYCRPAQTWTPGANTLASNLKEGLQIARDFGAEILAFVEDDDWYKSDYLLDSVCFLEMNPGIHCIGESRAKYYHLPSKRYRQLGNDSHASLCQTVITKDCFALLDLLLDRGTPHVDLLLWKEALCFGYGFLFPESDHVIGMKGLPGRSGIGIGHRPGEDWAVDESGEVLRSWIGEDYNLYKGLL